MIASGVVAIFCVDVNIALVAVTGSVVGVAIVVLALVVIGI